MEDIRFPPKHKLALGLCVLGLGFGASEVTAMTLSIDAGSVWWCECSPGISILTPMSSGPDGGIVIDQAQPASGSHVGPPDGSESPGIDAPWYWFNGTGMHLTTSPVTILSQSGNTMNLDFSGWSFTWNGYGITSLAGDAWGSNPVGVAEVTCGVDCANGDSYELRYTAIIPDSDPTGFAGVHYGLELHGTISAVPVPAAIWLFASGLFGLIGIGRTRN